MKQNLLENKINQTLNEFESMKNIEPSLDWENDLMNKISSKQSNSNGLKYSVLMILLMFINMAFLITFSSNKSTLKTNQRSEDLRSISNELLISPNSQQE